MHVSTTTWVVTIAVMALILLVDIVFIGRRPHEPTMRECVIAICIFVGAAVLFGLGIWFFSGGEYAGEFFGGWITEYSLSIDNLFVFIVIFGAFRVPKQLQHRVLFWGIVAALGMRAAMILGGTALLDRFEWLVYVFGATLVITGVKLFFGKESGVSGEGFMMRMVRKVIPATDQFHGQHFLARVNGRRC